MTLNTNKNSRNSGAKRHTHRVKMMRINLSIQDGLLNMVDEAAKNDFTTRSDIIRMALLWYLRPQGHELDQADPEAILKTLQHRRSRAAIRDMVKDINVFGD